MRLREGGSVERTGRDLVVAVLNDCKLAAHVDLHVFQLPTIIPEK